MRAILVTLLVLFFAGVHTANALTRVPRPAAPVERTLAMDAGTAMMTVLSQPRHLACCKQDDGKQLTAKVGNCSTDCASLQPAALHIQSLAGAGVEPLPQPRLTALAPVPVTQPPIRR